MKWPYRTVTTYNASQTRPYYTTGRIVYLVTHQDVSKYRYHHPQNTCQNEWGYFFPGYEALQPPSSGEFWTA